MGTAKTMFATIKRLRKNLREQVQLDDEWKELGRAGSLEELRVYMSPVLFGRFMRFEMEGDEPGLFSLADFFETSSVTKCSSLDGSAAWKREFVRALESFALACVVFLGVPDLNEVESFKVMKRLILHDTTVEIADAYVFYVVNSAVCRMMRKFKYELATAADGAEGLRGPGAFLKVGQTTFASTLSLIPEAGSDMSMVWAFRGRAYKEVKWKKMGRTILTEDEEEASVGGKKRTREAAAEKTARKTTKAKQAQAVAGLGSQAGVGRAQDKRRFCPFHTLGLLGVHDIGPSGPAGGQGLFRCRTVGPICASGKHSASLKEMTKKEALAAIDSLKGRALVEKGRAAVEAKLTQVFRQG